MQRHWRFLLLVVTTVMALVLPPRPSEAYVVTKTLAQTPVTGRLVGGGTFQGRLTVHALTVDEDGQLAATGILKGTVTTAPGAVTTIPAHPFTAPASLLDLRGTCTTLVLDLAPIVLAPLEQQVTLVPIVLGQRGAQQQESLLRTTLCTVARLQE
jgi:hypothetical protein